jgi:hypothetical protein
VSHEVHAISNGTYLDNNLVDDSYRIYTEAEMDAVFQPGWREHLHSVDSPYSPKDADRLANPKLRPKPPLIKPTRTVRRDPVNVWLAETLDLWAETWDQLDDEEPAALLKLIKELRKKKPELTTKDYQEIVFHLWQYLGQKGDDNCALCGHDLNLKGLALCSLQTDSCDQVGLPCEECTEANKANIEAGQ